MEKWINIQSLVKTLGNRGLKQLTLRLGIGVTAVIGSNGAGKTTLLRCLSTFYYPDAGKVKYGGLDIHRAKEAYCYVLGYLPEEFSGYEHMTCRIFLQYVAALKMIPAHMVVDRITHVIGLLNLEPYQDIRLERLSPGILHRLGLAQAILNDPEVLLLDEPTSGLDPVERKLVLNLLRDFGDDRIIVFATNLLNDAEDIADNVVILQAGRAVVHDKTHAIINLAQGLVWQGVITDIEESPNQIIISRDSLDGSTDPPIARVRVLASRCPFEEAKPVRANLEDAYIGVINGVIRI